VLFEQREKCRYRVPAARADKNRDRPYPAFSPRPHIFGLLQAAATTDEPPSNIDGTLASAIDGGLKPGFGLGVMGPLSFCLSRHFAVLEFPSDAPQCPRQFTDQTFMLVS
jgi:hypothetical protein